MYNNNNGWMLSYRCQNIPINNLFITTLLQELHTLPLKHQLLF